MEHYESILQLCNQFENLTLDDDMEQPTEAVQKEKAAKLKRAKLRAKKANAKAAAAKVKLEKLEKLEKIEKLNKAKDMMKGPFDGPSTSKAALRHDVESRSASKTKQRSSIAGEAIIEAPFDGPSTSKAALRRDVERRSASKTKQSSSIAGEAAFDGPSTSKAAQRQDEERQSASMTKQRSSTAGEAFLEAPFDGPSTSKATLRHYEERHSPSKAKKHSIVADEGKKKHNLKAVEKKYEGRHTFTFAGYRGLSQFPQRVGREKHISVRLEFNDSFKNGKRVMKVQPRVSPMNVQKEQPPKLDDETEFPALGE